MKDEEMDELMDSIPPEKKQVIDLLMQLATLESRYNLVVEERDRVREAFNNLLDYAYSMNPASDEQIREWKEEWISGLTDKEAGG